MSEHFLQCRIGSLPFKYLGFSDGCNPRNTQTWQPLMDLLSKRLVSLRHMFRSLDERVILLNVVNSLIPIFYMSYLRWRLLSRNKLVVFNGPNRVRNFSGLARIGCVNPKGRSVLE